MSANICNFPDLANSAALLKLSVDLVGIKDGGIIGMAIVNGAKSGKLKETIKMIRSQYFDNPELMREILGEKLLSDCLTVKLREGYKPITESKEQDGKIFFELVTDEDNGILDAPTLALYNPSNIHP